MIPRPSSRPALEMLEDRCVPAAPTIFAIGSQAGSAVDVYDAATGNLKYALQAFDTGFNGGVRVAVSSYNGEDLVIAAAGPGGVPLVRVFNGSDGSPLAQFTAFDPGFSGGLSVAAGDLYGDGVPEIVTGAEAAPGGYPLISVHDLRGNQIGPNILAFDSGFHGGVRVAVGDFTGTGKDDIAAAAGPGGFPMVQILDGRTYQREASFQVFDSGFHDGVYVAAGRLDNSGMDRLVVGAGGGHASDEPVLREFDAAGNLLHDYVLAFDPSYHGGVAVTTASAFGASLDTILADPIGDHTMKVQALDALFSKLPQSFYGADAYLLIGGSPSDSGSDNNTGSNPDINTINSIGTTDNITPPIPDITTTDNITSSIPDTSSTSTDNSGSSDCGCNDSSDSSGFDTSFLI